MPKQAYKIDKFHGGLNSNSDPRDIAESELSEAQDVMVDEIGRIRTLGGTLAHQSNDTGVGAHNSHITPGYGLFQWNHDRIDGHTVGVGSNDPETGANYLAFSDTDAHSSGKLVRIYSAEDDTWGEPITGLSDNTGGNRKDVFYSVDGALRVCDSLFTNTNSSKWYGYIDKEFMYNSGSTVSVDQWISKSQYIEKPGANSGWDDTIRASTTTAATSYTTTSTGIGSALTGAGTMYYFEDGTALNAKAGAITNIYQMLITIRVNYDGVDDSDWHYTITAGDATNSTTPAGSLGTNHKSTSYLDIGSVEDTGVIEDRVHTLTFAVGDTPIADEGTTGAIVKLVVGTMGSDVNSIDIHQVVIIEGSASGVAAHDGVDGNDIDTNEVFIDAAFETTTDAIGWDRKWEHGFSFIYDGKQESLVRRIEKVDPSSGASTPPTYEQAVTDSAHAPSVRISVPYASNWSPRITGGVWYIRDVSGTVPSKWWGQIECNFVQGTGKVLSSGKEFDCEFNPNTSEYNFNVDHENLLQPNQVDTYRSRNGFSEDNESITARFKTAVQVGRRMYIGNVQILKEDGTKEVKGDAMLKSPVNKFDTFPSKSIVEAAVNDGESIVALEEFADRILQFKERTLYVINVSRDIEFLEDVHKHKGCSHPAAVCKTDYGIAWVNRLGCYLYDGKQVINLLEKGGRQIIKEQEWFNFLTPGKDSSYAYLNGAVTSGGSATIMTDSLGGGKWIAGALVGGTIYNVTDGSFGLITANAATTVTSGTLQGGSGNTWDTSDVYRLDITNTVMTPMIGYLPQKRQLVVYDDITDTGLANPRMYLYDMVTQSWVKGANDTSNRIIDTVKTNFVTDWNGDLVYGYTLDSGNLLKWDDASTSSDTLVLKTKDIDFGHPGVRKKVYKVYITYKGDGRYAKIYYGKDGLEPTLNFSAITSGTDGSSTGGTADSSPLADAGVTDWLKAELKPTASINNISSFRLIVEGNTGGTAIASDFEINDITIIYRLKPVN